MDLFSIGFVVCTLSGIACFWLFFKMYRLVREDLKKERRNKLCTQHYL